MQRVTILCVGKLKEKFYIDAAAEYVKRLQRYCKLDIVELPDHSFIIRGVTPLEDVEEALGVSFGEDEIETLNGFLISVLDRIPADDEHIVINHSGYRFEVQSIQNKVIQKVHVSRLPESTGTESE